MTTLLFGALWVHLAQCVLLNGAFFLLLLAGPPATDFIRLWEQRVLCWARWLVILALASGAAVSLCANDDETSTPFEFRLGHRRMTSWLCPIQMAQSN
jgi:hypothetical protein